MGQHAKCRPLREELYRAFITRASSEGSDNGPIIERILVLRRERAELLGFSNHAEVRGDWGRMMIMSVVHPAVTHLDTISRLHGLFCSENNHFRQPMYHRRFRPCQIVNAKIYSSTS